MSDAFELVNRAAALAEEGSWDSSDLKVQRADLLVSLGDADGVAPPRLRRGRAAGARMTQLKAATRLARLAQKTGGPDAAGILREVLETFSLRKALRADIDESAWASLYRPESRPFPAPETGKIAVKVINHYGDEVMKVYDLAR